MIGAAIDKLMDWTVVPGYSRVGYSVRRRLWSGPIPTPRSPAGRCS